MTISSQSSKQQPHSLLYLYLDMARLTRDDVLKLAQLAQIDLSEDEIKRFQGEISEILEYVALLEAVNLDNLEPTDQVTGLVSVMRDDTIIDYGITPAALLNNVPATLNDQIKVKRTLT